MGVEQLLQFIKPALQEIHISRMYGKTAAIDASSWLYKGCYSCAEEINTKKPTSDYLYYIQKMIGLLKDYNIRPVMVFDGMKLRAKERTAVLRKKVRNDNLKKAYELKDEGNPAEADRFFKRSLKITKEMLYTTIDVLHKMEIDFVVAPYEADAQLAHLVQIGFCDFAITDDSDLICFQCPRIVFKLGPSGDCLDLRLAELKESRNLRQEIIGDKADVRKFFSFNSDKMIDCCIMSGCDYLPSIKSIGIRRSVDLLDQQGNIYYAVKKLRAEKRLQGLLPEKYEHVVQTIRLIFKFQTVYDPLQKKFTQLNQEEFQQFLTQLHDTENQAPDELMPWVINEAQLRNLIGPKIDDDQAELYAEGLIDVKTKQLRERTNPDFPRLFNLFKSARRVYQVQDSSNRPTQPIIDYNVELQLLDSYDDYDAKQSTTPQKGIQQQQQKQVKAKPTQIQTQMEPIINNEVDQLMNLCDEIFHEFDDNKKRDDNQSDSDAIHMISQSQKLNPFASQMKQANLSANFSQKTKNLQSIAEEDLIKKPFWDDNVEQAMIEKKRSSLAQQTTPKQSTIKVNQKPKQATLGNYFHQK